MTRIASSTLSALLLTLAGTPVVASAEDARPAVAPDTILYGAAYYHE